MKIAALACALAVGLTAGAARAETPSTSERIAMIAAATDIAAGADRADWDRVRAAFDDQVATDYTSLFGGEPVVQDADTLVEQWSNFLPGFDETQHMLSNFAIVSYDGDVAAMQADFQATHRIGDALWTLGGRYDYALSRRDDRWVVSSLTMTAVWETGDRGMIAQAAERARAQTTIAIVRSFYALFEEKNIPALVALFAEDAVLETPFAPPGSPMRVEGRDAIAALFAPFPASTGAARFEISSIHPTDAPNRVLVEVDGVIDFLGVDAPYRRRHVSVFDVRQGRIQLFRAYFNPIPFAEAVGLGRFVASD